MKYALITLSIAGMLASTTALAANISVENSLKSRSDLSTFYQAMVNTGVINELNPNTRYTIFAPTNDAFAKISSDRYPCFYSSTCREEVADIVRNHIVPGEEYVSDIVKQKGGVYSIDNRFIAIGMPYRNNYSAAGHNIVSTSMTSGGLLYKLDGLIADERELSMVETPRYYSQVVTTTRTVPAQVVTTTPVITATPVVMTTTPVYYDEPVVTRTICNYDDCPDTVSTTTVIEQHVIPLEPAR